jgi:hypothetical protein
MLYLHGSILELNYLPILTLRKCWHYNKLLKYAGVIRMASQRMDYKANLVITKQARLLQVKQHCSTVGGASS